MPRLVIIADTAAEASAAYIAQRDASGQGASTFPEGEWRGNRISYNGRVWRGAGWPNDKAIFNPGTGPTPDYWRDTTAPEALVE